jgi:signal transduction histidine kinase
LRTWHQTVLKSPLADAQDALRDAEIRALDLIDQPMPDVLQRLVGVAARVTGAAVAEIHVITSSEQVTLASTGPTPDPCSTSISYCARIVRETERDHLVPDVRLDDRFKDSPFTTSGAVTTYAASQLVTSSGTPIGTLCIFDPQPRDIDQQMMDVLSELSEAVTDVLEARRHQDAMQDSLVTLSDGQRELRRSNEHLAAFAGQVSHDIQGPLSAVLMSLQLMEEELSEAPGTMRERYDLFVRSALSGADRMRTTIAGLMDFAVLGGTLTPSCLDMDTVVRDVIADLSARMGRSRVVVGALPEVWGDDVQVRAVTQNLVANALKYAGHVAEPTIRIEGQALGDRTRISVSENGPGVPERERDAIFGLLVRGEETDQSGVDGLGIGLATCRRIVQAHGGEIGVQTSQDGGAEFWFELPVPGTD